MRRSLAAAALAVALFLAGCTGQSPAGQATDGAGTLGYEAGDGSVVIVPAAERQPAPELRGTTLDGTELSTADHAGSVIVINVWGSWCSPCRAEAVDLVTAAAERPDAFFLGLNTRDLDPAPAKAFVRAFGVTYPNLYDPDGSLLLAFGQLPPKAIPSTLVIDAQGRVAARILGATTTATLTGVIDDVSSSG